MALLLIFFCKSISINPSISLNSPFTLLTKNIGNSNLIVEISLLSIHFSLPKIQKRTHSKDGSIKYLMELNDGAIVESVWMPSDSRKTLCLSTQVGCRLNCSFCLTASLGLKRNLTAGEIIGQHIAINEELEEKDQITNVVISRFILRLPNPAHHCSDRF